MRLWQRLRGLWQRHWCGLWRPLEDDGISLVLGGETDEDALPSLAFLEAPLAAPWMDSEAWLTVFLGG